MSRRAVEVAAAGVFAAAERVTLFDVPLVNVTRPEAIDGLAQWIAAPAARARAVYLVNAHTLNLACADPAYRALLAAGDAVFGDGTGVRWAARIKGKPMRDNLVGTDLVPELFAALGERGLRCYLLGGTPETAVRAAAWVRERFPAVNVVGCRDGFVWKEDMRGVVRAINDSQADVLLVGMGNPLQETWIARERDALRVPVAIGVGGLFDHWAGTLRRAAPWIRQLGIEWVQILLQQPSKWQRYIVGNPLFLARAVWDAYRS